MSFVPDGTFEDRRSDVVDGPPVPEGVPYLTLCDPPRKRVFAGLLIAEAEHEVVPAGRENGCKALHEDRPVFVGEGMEESGIDDGIERPAEPGEVQRVPDTKARLKPSFSSLLLCLLDRESGGVDSDHLIPFPCKKEGMLPRSAPYIQDGAGNLSRPGELDERLLGPADVPGRCAPVDRVEDIHRLWLIRGRLNRFRGIQIGGTGYQSKNESRVYNTSHG